jgi:hypothetical protein
MLRPSLCSVLAALTVIAVAPSADARTARTTDSAGAFAGAHNSVTDENSIRQKCYEYANTTWRTSNQELQTARDYAYRTCAFEHGVRNP